MSTSASLEHLAHFSQLLQIAGNLEGNYTVRLPLAGRFVRLPYQVVELKAAVCPLWLPNGKRDMAGHQVKVLIAVKQAARVAQGNGGNQMNRRRDGQPVAPCERSDTPISKPMP